MDLEGDESLERLSLSLQPPAPTHSKVINLHRPFALLEPICALKSIGFAHCLLLESVNFRLQHGGSA